MPQNLLVDAQSYQGIFPPLVLPLTAKATTDFDSLARLLEFQLACGVDGFWINGTSGEFFALRREERIEILEFVLKKVNGRVPIIAHVGEASTRLTLEQAPLALQLGAKALAVVPPYYMPATQEELKRHYRTIHREVGQPLFLYHVPSMCKCSLTVPNIVELAREGVLVGLKDSAASIEGLARLIRDSARESLPLRCFNGNSALLETGYFVGAHGFMGAITNMLPAQCKKIHVAASRGEWDAVRTMSARITAALETFGTYPQPVSFTWINKWALCELGVIADDTIHLPAAPADEAAQQHFRNVLMPLVRELTPAAALTP